MKNEKIIVAAFAILCAALLAGCASKQTKQIMTYRQFTEHVKVIQETNEKSCVNGCIAFEGDSNFELINFQQYFSSPACNYAFRGSMTTDLLKRREKLFALKPAVIVLLVGANDLVRRTPLPEINRNYEELLQYYKSFCGEIYCISNLPVDPSIFVKNSTLIELNSLLEETCKKMGAAYINVYPSLLKNGGLNPDYAIDPVHLNKAGQDILMDILKKNLQSK